MVSEQNNVTHVIIICKYHIRYIISMANNVEVLATFQITGNDLIITGNRTYFYNSNYIIAIML